MAGPTKDKQTAAQKATQFQGERSNRNTKGNSKVRIQKSKLRNTVDKLREMEETCLANIKDSVEGREVEAKRLSTSQWVITSIASIERAAAQEEASLTKLRMEGKRDTDEDEQASADVLKLVPVSRLRLDFPGDDPEVK